jgi:pimeloyl-ACP methyl ester carboxylesterase
VNSNHQTISAPLQKTRTWIAQGSTSIIPPADYWAYLARGIPDPQIERLQELSDKRLSEFTPSALPPPADTAIELLEHIATDGWLKRQQRQTCPNCDFVLSDEEAKQPTCSRCAEPFSERGGVIAETIYVRDLASTRDVDWVVAIHGMNTTGAWQEAFTWHMASTWGRSVPVAVYKYGIVIAGVIMAWRRRKLRDTLRDKLAVLRDEARAQGFAGKPDVIAHSFGTWLLGHLLQKELEREPEDRLRFGRIILTGCVLRPDFNWKNIKDAKLVDDVLNHCGSKDSIVPLAHATIWDSGPSGRRGFDGDDVINVCTDGFGHSDLFSIEKFVRNGKYFQSRTGAAEKVSFLEYSYNRYWRPFLTLPESELRGLPDCENPRTKWRELPWPLRGTIFPFVSLPFVLGVVLLLLAKVGPQVERAGTIVSIVITIGAAGVSSLLTCIALAWSWGRYIG